MEAHHRLRPSERHKLATRQLLQITGAAVVANDHRTHAQHGLQHLHQQRLACLHRLGRGLDDRRIRITIHKQAGQLIGLAVDHAIGVAGGLGIVIQRATTTVGGEDSLV